MYEEDGSGLVGAGITEEVEVMQKNVKYSSLLSYMLKPSHLVTQVFENNRTAQENIFKHMCCFGEHIEWMEGTGVFSSYLDFETTKYQCRPLNPTPLDFIAGYIMQYDVGDKALKRLPQRRLYFIDGYIKRYCYILNSPGLLEQIKKKTS